MSRDIKFEVLFVLAGLALLVGLLYRAVINNDYEITALEEKVEALDQDTEYSEDLIIALIRSSDDAFLSVGDYENEVIQLRYDNGDTITIDSRPGLERVPAGIILVRWAGTSSSWTEFTLSPGNAYTLVSCDDILTGVFDEYVIKQDDNACLTLMEVTDVLFLD